MRTSWETPPSSSSCEENDELAPTQLLSLAIKKRRSLYESKDRDYRRELLHTGMIQSLCKFLGEGRALRRRSKRKRRTTNSQTSPANGDLPLRYQVTNADLENMMSRSEATPIETREPTMLELNGGSGDDDAVVPVMKRPKYEQVFETEPTEQEKEIIKEYVYEDFYASLASFYTPNEYSVEPTKDPYWCSIGDTNFPHFELDMPPDIELLAFCS